MDVLFFGARTGFVSASIGVPLKGVLKGIHRRLLVGVALFKQVFAPSPLMAEGEDGGEG